MLRQQKGFTLIELLTAVALSLVLFSTIISLTITLAKSEVNRIKTQKAESLSLKAAKLIMSDVKRAGYKNSAFTDVNSGNNNNRFINIHNTPINCISLSYDKNHDDTLIKSRENYTEKYAYRLFSSDLQTMTSRSRGTNPAATACDDGDDRWTALLSPPNFTATGLLINNRTQTISTLSEPGTSIETRAFDIEIQGTSPVKFTVKNRNDKFND